MIRFTVTGRGKFPVDMLRYDECYPADGLSAAGIQDDERHRRSITLITNAKYSPTEGRWRSFGWACTPGDWYG